MQSKSDVDVVVIGAGIGGLSCASILAKYGKRVHVVESHSIPGGCAHSFERDGFVFDSGPSLYAGMTRQPYNPLRRVLDIIEEEVDWISYDGWGCYTPSGFFRFETGPSSFRQTCKQFGGPSAQAQWDEFMKLIYPVAKASAAVNPFTLRSDLGAILTISTCLPGLLQAAPLVSKLQLPFSELYEDLVTDRFLRQWLDFLSFAISGVPASSTLSAAMAYTIGDLHREGAMLDYPRGGGKAIIDALVRGVTKNNGQISYNSHVKKILTDESGRLATGVQLRNGTIIHAKEAVVSNVPIWSMVDLVPEFANPTPKTGQYKDEVENLRQTDSFMHLHIGIKADGLKDLDIHHTIINDWSDCTSEGNLIAVSIPTVLDPSLAPDGHHVIHAYCAGNEPYALWEGMSRSSQDYKNLKKERSEVLWRALERIIPDVRERTVLELQGSPLTHERFNRRIRGTYGPAFMPGQERLPGVRTPIRNLLQCGDSVFPGIGVPAVAVSGAEAAHTLTSVWKHLQTVQSMA